MTTTTTTRTKGRSETVRRGHPARPGNTRRAARPGAGSSAASRKAYVRRERRIGGVGGNGEAVAQRLAGPRELARKIPFVVLVMALFVAGIGLTLWLSTSATAHSYQIASAKEANTALEDQKEALEQVVQAGNSAPELARKAAELGMVQAEDVARLVVAPDGSVTVAGTPEPAEGAAPTDLGRAPAPSPGTEPPAETPPQPQPAPHTGAAPSESGPEDVLPPAGAAPSPAAGTQVLAAGGDGTQQPAPPAEPAPPDDAAPPAPPADAPPAPPADAPPIPPADAARGASGPADGTAPGAE